MKKLIIISLFIVANVVSLAAQPHRGARRGKGNLEEFQTELIMRQIELDYSKQADFKAIYSEYFDQMEALRPKAPGRAEFEKLDDQTIEKQILNSFDMAEEATAIKREYYAKFKTVLTPRQILKMYNVERHIADRARSEIENRGRGAKRGGSQKHQR